MQDMNSIANPKQTASCLASSIHTWPRGAERLSPHELQDRIAAGDRCVRFEVCLSFLLGTVRHQSAVYLTTSWEKRYLRGLGYCVPCLMFGPWGVPWGLLWTPQAVWVNLTGGVDVTDEVVAVLGLGQPATQNA